MESTSKIVVKEEPEFPELDQDSEAVEFELTNGDDPELSIGSHQYTVPRGTCLEDQSTRITTSIQDGMLDIPHGLKIEPVVKIEPESEDGEFPKPNPPVYDMASSVSDTPATVEQHANESFHFEIDIKVEPDLYSEELTETESSGNTVDLPVTTTLTAVTSSEQRIEIKVEDDQLEEIYVGTADSDPHIDRHCTCSGQNKDEIKAECDPLSEKESGAELNEYEGISESINYRKSSSKATGTSMFSSLLPNEKYSTSKTCIKVEADPVIERKPKPVLKCNAVSDTPATIEPFINQSGPNKISIKVESDPLCDESSKSVPKDNVVADIPAMNEPPINQSGPNKTESGPNKTESEEITSVSSMQPHRFAHSKTAVEVQSSNESPKTVPKKNAGSDASYPRKIKTETKVGIDSVSQGPLKTEAKHVPDAAASTSERVVISQGTAEEEAILRAKECIKHLANRAAKMSGGEEGVSLAADPYARFRHILRHPKCAYSLDELKKMAERIPERFGVWRRINFIRECYKFGRHPNTWEWQLYNKFGSGQPTPHPKCKFTLDELKGMAKGVLKGEKRGTFMILVYHRGRDPHKLMKQLTQDRSAPWCGFITGKHSWSDRYAMLDKSFPDPNCKHTLKELKHLAEQIPESFGIETRLKFIYRCYKLGRDPTVEDWTQYIVNPYYEFEDCPPHKYCKHSLDELKSMAERIPESLGIEARAQFVFECYRHGRNPDVADWTRYQGKPKKLLIINPFKVSSSTVKTGRNPFSEFEGMPPHRKCKYSLEKIKDLSEQISASFGIETRVHFVRRCYRFGHDPAAEDWTMYQKPVSLRFPINADNPYAEFDGMLPGNNCTHSLEEIKRMAEQIPESFGIEARVKFIRRCYRAGKDPATEDWTQYNIDPYFEIKERPPHKRCMHSFKNLKKLAERIPESWGIWPRINFVRRCYQNGKNPFTEDWTKYKIDPPIHPDNQRTSENSNAAIAPPARPDSQKTLETSNTSDSPPNNSESPYAEFEEMPPHPKCKQSLDEIKQMAERIHESFGLHTRVHFVRRCYRFGHHPAAEDWTQYSKPTHIYPPINVNGPFTEFNQKRHKNIKHSLDEIIRVAEQIPESFGIEAKVNFIRRCSYYGKNPDEEDWTLYNLDPYFFIKEKPQHPECKQSFEKLKRLAENIPESCGIQTRVSYVRRCYVLGRDPYTEDWTRYKCSRPAAGSTYVSGKKRQFQEEVPQNVSQGSKYEQPNCGKENPDTASNNINIHKENRSLEELESIAEQIWTRVKSISNFSKFQKITEDLAQNNVNPTSGNYSMPGHSEYTHHPQPIWNTEHPHAGPKGIGSLQGNHALEELKTMALQIADRVNLISNSNEFRGIEGDVRQSNNFNRNDNYRRCTGSSEPAKNPEQPPYKRTKMSHFQENAWPNREEDPNSSYKRTDVSYFQAKYHPEEGPTPDSERTNVSGSQGNVCLNTEGGPNQSYNSTTNEHTDTERHGLKGFSKFIRQSTRHPGCKLSIEALEHIAFRLPSQNAVKRFMLQTYCQGKDPYQLLEAMEEGHSDSISPNTGSGLQNTSSEFANGLPSSLGSWQEPKVNSDLSTHLKKSYTADAWNASTEEQTLKNLPYLPRAGSLPFNMMSILTPTNGMPSNSPANSSPVGRNVPSFPPLTVGATSPLIIEHPKYSSHPNFECPPSNFPATSPLPFGHLLSLQPPNVNNLLRNPPTSTSLAAPPLVAGMPVITPVTGNLPPNPPLGFLSIPPPTVPRLPWNLAATTLTASLAPPISNPATGPPFTPVQHSQCTTNINNSSNVTVIYSDYANQTDSYKLAETNPKPKQDASSVSVKRIVAYKELAETQQKLEQDSSSGLKKKTPCQEHIPPKRPLTVGKPPKVVNNGSEDTIVPLYIAPSGYPNVCLSEEQMNVIENDILEAILEIDDASIKPSFKESFRRNGQFGFVCSDDFTRKWLYTFLRTYQPWPNLPLTIHSNCSSKVRANAILPLCNDDDEKILKFIGKQNSGLNISKWETRYRWDTSDSKTCMDLMVDEESAKILESCSRINFKLGSGQIIIVRKIMDVKETGNPSGPEKDASPWPFGSLDEVPLKNSRGVRQETRQKHPSSESQSQNPVQFCLGQENQSQNPAQSSQCLGEDHRENGGTRSDTHDSPVYRSLSLKSVSSDEELLWHKGAHSSKKGFSSSSSSLTRLIRSKKLKSRVSGSPKIGKSRISSSEHSEDDDRHQSSTGPMSSASSGRASCRQDQDRGRRRVQPSPYMQGSSQSPPDACRQKIHDRTESRLSGRATSKQEEEANRLHDQPLTSRSPDTFYRSEGELSPSPPPHPPRSGAHEFGLSPSSLLQDQPLQDAATDRFRRFIAAGFSRDEALKFSQAYVRRQLKLQPPVTPDLQSSSSDTDPTESLPTPKKTASNNVSDWNNDSAVTSHPDDAEMAHNMLKWFYEK